MDPTEGWEHSLIFPSATYRALLLPRRRMAREGPAIPSTPRHQKAAQILLEQGLPRVGVLQGTARPGLAEGHLPSVVRDFRSQQGHPGRSASGCRIAPCSDRFHNSAGTGHYGVKQRAGCRAGCQKGAAHGVSTRPFLVRGTWGCHTERNKASTWVRCLQTTSRTKLSYRDARTHTHTGPWSALPRGHRRGQRERQEEVGGVKVLAWHQAEPPRPGALWAVSEGRSPVPHPIGSCPSLQHATLPRGTAGSKDHGESDHPSNTSRQECCRLRRELKSA